MVSAISQTYRPLEIIVSDDASVGCTIDIVGSFRERTEIPIFIFNHKPQGIGANWKNTVIHSNGEYIKFLFQDDLMYPDCIRVMMDAALQHAEIGWDFYKRKISGDVNSNEDKQWVQICGDLHKHWCKILPLQNCGELLRDPDLLKTPRNKVGEPVAVLL